MLPCLLELGMSEYDINDLQRMNDDLIYAWDDEIRPYIEFFQAIGCTKQQIISIVSSNPFVFDYKLEQVISVCGYLKGIIKIDNLPAIITIHPYLLNKSVQFLKKFVQEKLDEGMTLRQLKRIITERPFFIDSSGY